MTYLATRPSGCARTECTSGCVHLGPKNEPCWVFYGAATTGQNSEPHPRWKPNNGSDRHPQTVEEWDYGNDPTGGAFGRSLRRLVVAGDYDDPRAPDQMALVLRIDVLRLIGDWHHKNAAWEAWRKERTERASGEIEDKP